MFLELDTGHLISTTQIGTINPSTVAGEHRILYLNKSDLLIDKDKFDSAESRDAFYDKIKKKVIAAKTFIEFDDRLVRRDIIAGLKKSGLEIVLVTPVFTLYEPMMNSEDLLERFNVLSNDLQGVDNK